MSITLYARRDFKGDDITGFDLSHFSQIAHPMTPTSIRMTAASDRILLFTRPNWQGRAMFLSGAQAIEHLGRPGDGGELGFGNTISSMRVTPFRLRLRFHVVTDSAGNLPAGFSSLAAAETVLRATLTVASQVWQQYLIRFEFEGIRLVADQPQLFELSGDMARMMAARNKVDRLEGGANVLVVNQLGPNREGQAVPHLLSHMLAVEGGVSPLVLAHELGHFFGLYHRSQKPDNLMSPVVGNDELSDRQIEEAHENFARFSGLEHAVRIE